MKTRIMLVDDNAEFINSAKEYFDKSDAFEVVATACDGIDAIEKFASSAPDAVVLDLVMPRMDGFGVLERIAGKTKVVILSALSQDAFISKAMSMGADYYMMKPASFDNLCLRLNDCCNKTFSKAEKVARERCRELEERISNIFITVGIPAHIKGYQFLREAVKMAIDDPAIVNSITKQLYPEVANKFNTSPSKVERAIRHAIEVAWNRGKIENINLLFGVRIYNHNEKPTNGEFIALVADKMLLESV